MLRAAGAQTLFVTEEGRLVGHVTWSEVCIPTNYTINLLYLLLCLNEPDLSKIVCLILFFFLSPCLCFLFFR